MDNQRHKPTICINIKDVDDIEYDAFISSAYYQNRECTEAELEYLMEHYPEVVNEMAHQSLIP